MGQSALSKQVEQLTEENTKTNVKLKKSESNLNKMRLEKNNLVETLNKTFKELGDKTTLVVKSAGNLPQLFEEDNDAEKLRYIFGYYKAKEEDLNKSKKAIENKNRIIKSYKDQLFTARAKIKELEFLTEKKTEQQNAIKERDNTSRELSNCTCNFQGQSTEAGILRKHLRETQLELEKTKTMLTLQMFANQTVCVHEHFSIEEKNDFDCKLRELSDITAKISSRNADVMVRNNFPKDSFNNYVEMRGDKEEVPVDDRSEVGEHHEDALTNSQAIFSQETFSVELQNTALDNKDAIGKINNLSETITNEENGVRIDLQNSEAQKVANYQKPHKSTIKEEVARTLHEKETKKVRFMNTGRVSMSNINRSKQGNVKVGEEFYIGFKSIFSLNLEDKGTTTTSSIGNKEEIGASNTKFNDNLRQRANYGTSSPLHKPYRRLENEKSAITDLPIGKYKREDDNLSEKNVGHVMTLALETKTKKIRYITLRRVLSVVIFCFILLVILDLLVKS